MAYGSFTSQTSFAAGGGIEGYSRQISLKPGTYKFSYHYEMYEIPDQLVIRAAGREFVDTGLVSGSKSASFTTKIVEGQGLNLKLIGGDVSSTQWNFDIKWDNLSGKPVAEADSVQLDEEDPHKPVKIDVALNDHDPDGTIDRDTVKIVDGPKFGTARVNVDGSITYQQTSKALVNDRLTYTVLDNDGNVSNVASVSIRRGDCPDPTPITVYNAEGREIIHEGTDCIVPDTAVIGRIDGLSDELHVTSGTVRLMEGRVDAKGEIAVSITGEERSLFHGQIMLDGREVASGGSVRGKPKISGDEGLFTIGGLQFRTSELELGKDRVDLNGTFLLPEIFGNTAITLLPKVNSVTVGPTGVFVYVPIEFPNVSFKFGTGWELKSEKAGIGYDGVADALNVHGVFTLQTPLFKTKTGDGGAGLKLDLSEPVDGSTTGQTGVIIKDGKVNGIVKAGLSNVYLAGATLEEITVLTNWADGVLAPNGGGPAVEATVGVKFDVAKAVAGFSVPNIKGTLGFTRDTDDAAGGVFSYRPDKIALEVKDRNIPVGTSGVFLQDIKGALVGIGYTGTTDTGISGGLRFTAGPQIVASVPKWLDDSGEIKAALVSVSVDGGFKQSASTGHATADGDLGFALISDNLAKLTFHGTLDFDGGAQTGSGDLTLFGGLMTGKAALGYAPYEGAFSMSGSVEGKLPSSGFGRLSGKSLGELSFEARVSEFDTNDYIILRGRANFGDFFDIPAGVKIDLNDLKHVTPLFGKDAVKVGSWDTVADQPWLVMAADWTEPLYEGAHVRVRYTPDTAHMDQFVEYTRDEFDTDTNGLAVLGDFTSEYGVSVVVQKPAVGRWDIYVDDPDLGTVTTTGYRPNIAPTLAINGQGSGGGDYTVFYTVEDADADPGELMHVRFFLDGDDQGFDGVEIGSADVASGQHEYSFRPPFIAGSPHIYVKVEDAGLDIVERYAFDVEVESGANLQAVRSTPVFNVLDSKLLTYTVTVTNSGTTTARDVSYVETWDKAHFVNVSGATIVGVTDHEARLRPSFSSDLAPGESATFTFTLRTDVADDGIDDVPPPPPEDGGDESAMSFAASAVGGGGTPASGASSSLAALHLVGRVSSRGYEDDLRDNLTETDLPFVTKGVASAANGQDTDLKIEHIALTEPGADTAVRYELVVTNMGEGTAGGVTLVDTLAGATVSNMRLLIPNSDDYTVQSIDASGRIELLLRDLPAGERLSIPIEFVASEGQPITSAASVAQVGTDPDPTNDADTALFMPAGGAGRLEAPVDWQFTGATTSLVPDQDGNVFLAAQLRNQTGYYSLTGSVTLKLTLPDGVTYTGAALSPEFDTARQNAGYTIDHLVGTSSYGTVATVSADGHTVIIKPPSNVGGGSAPVFDAGYAYYGQTNFYLGFNLHVDGTLPKEVSLEIQTLEDPDPDSTPGNGVATEDDFVSFHINATANAAPTVTAAVPTLMATQHAAFSYTLAPDLFVDADGDALQIRASTLPRWLAYDAANRTLSGTPGAFDVSTPNNGTTDSVTLLAEDGRGGRVSISFEILIDDVEDAPVAIRPYEDRVAYVGVPFTYTLPANYVASSASSETADRSASYFFDPDWTGRPSYSGSGQPFVDGNFKFSVADLPSWLSSPSDGSASQASPVLTGIPTEAGTYTVTVKAGYNDPDFTDRLGTQTFTITVVPIEPPVSGGPLTYTAHQHQAFSQVLPASAFTDPNGDPLSLWITDAPAWLGFDPATRTFSGTPDADGAGAYQVTLHASDGKLGYASLPVTITVSDENLAPEAILDGYAVAAGRSVAVTSAAAGVLGNDGDPDDDALAATVVSGPSHAASFAFNADGTFSYTPAAGFVGQDKFTYEASDGQGGVARANVLLEVGHAPVGAADAYATLEEFAISVDAAHGVLANDTDVDGGALRANLVSGPAHGTLTLNLDGSFDYAPTKDFHGTDTFTYRVGDGRLAGGPVTVSLDVTNLNDRPALPGTTLFFAGDLTGSGAPVSFAPGTLLAGMSDPDGDALSAVLTGQPYGATMSVDPDGGFRITPAPFAYGSFRFEYVVSDGTAVSTAQTAYVYLAKPADAVIGPPVARDDVYTVAAGATLLTADNRYSGRIDATHAPGLLVNDDQPGWSNFDQIPVGRSSPLFSKVLDAPDHGVLTFSSDYYGVFSYAPEAGFTGVDAFTYEVFNGGSGETATAKATIYVGGTEPANAKPVAVADSYTIPEDGSLVLSGASGVLANDTDADGDPLTLILESGNTKGYFGTAANGSVFYRPYDYVNDENNAGPITFTYRAYDGRQVSDPVTVTIHVTPGDEPLDSFYDGAIFYYEQYDGAVKTGRLDPFLIGPDKPSAVTAIQGRADLVGTPFATSFGTLEIEGDGSYRYTLSPERASLVGQYQDKLSIAFANSLGSVEKVFRLYSAFVDNDATGTSTSYTVTKDRALQVGWTEGVLKTVIDPDGGLRADPFTYHGQGDLRVVESGSFLYTPKAGYTGDDTFQVAVRSGTGATAYESVTFHVVEVGNGLPASNPDSYALDEDATLSVAADAGVLANDADPDGQPITAALVAGPQHGTLDLRADGSFTYRAQADFHGTDSFTYRAGDGTDQGDVQTATITVRPIQDQPVAVDDGGFSTAFGTALTIAKAGLLANDRDPDGDPLQIASLGGATHGTVAMSGGDVVFTPEAGYSGMAAFTYTVSDGAGGSDTALVSLVVRPSANAAPVAQADAYSTARGRALTVSAGDGVLANDRDPDGTALTAILAADPEHGGVQLAPDGSFIYTPAAGFVGSDHFTYTASDGALASTPTRVDIAASSSRLVLRVAEDAYQGDAQFTVTVDGRQVGGIYTARADHASGQWDDVAIMGDFGPAGPQQVVVSYVNDLWAGDRAHDRNLYVQNLTVDGATYDGVRAVNSYAAGALPGSALMAKNGTLTFDTSYRPTSLTVRVSEDAYDGHAQFVLTVDGRQVGGVYTTQAAHASGAWEDVTVTGDFGPAGPQQVVVSYVNDLWAGDSAHDRNLYVQSVSVGGATYDGVRAANSFAGGALSDAALMPKNGTLTFDTSYEPTTLTLRVSEDAYKGHAQFTVNVDGRQVGGVYTTQADHAAGVWDDVTITGDFGAAGPESVTIKFLNDLYEGDRAHDRNLYVQSIAVSDDVQDARAGVNLTTLGSTLADGVLMPQSGSLVMLPGMDAVVKAAGGPAVLAGTAGHDAFVFQALLPNGAEARAETVGQVAFGHHTVSGFEFGADTLVVDRLFAKDATALLAHTADQDGHAVITFNDASSVGLAGITSAQLAQHTADMLFV